MNPKISIIIPCYNEARNIGSALEKIAIFFNNTNYQYEIIVVDDDSTDETAEIAENFGAIVLKNEKNKGKGYSVKKGMEEANGDLILFTDADLSAPIEEFNKLIKYIDEHDIVIGSRALKDSEVEKPQPWYKSTIGKIGNLFIRLVLGLKIKDTQCGFKLFKRQVLDIFQKQTIDRWGFDFEILFIAKQKGYKIKEVGVRWINDPASKVTVRGYLGTLEEVLKVRFNKYQ